MKREIENARAELRALWRGESRPADLLLGFLLSLHYAALLAILLLWFHRDATLDVRLVWRVFLEGFVLVPPLALIMAIVVWVLAGRRSNDRAETLASLIAMNALSLIAVAAVIRSVGAEWSQTSSSHNDRVHALAAVIPLLLNAAILAALRSHKVARLPPKLRAWVVASTPLALTSALTLLSVSTPPAFPLAAILVAPAALAIGRERIHLRPPAIVYGLADALVVVTIGWLVFDPHLHADAHHHVWYLAPAHAVMHGGTVLGDIVTAYGILPIYLLAAFFGLGILPISYGAFSALLSALLVAEYVLVYALLRLLRVSLGHAVLGVGMVLLVNFVGTHGALTCFPSIGPLRFGIPYLLVLIPILRGRRPERTRSLAALEAVVVAVASLWSLETFLLTVATYLGIVTLEAAIASRRGIGLRSTLARVSYASLSVAVIHVAFAAFVQLRTSHWPLWDAYIELVFAYTPAGSGVLLLIPPKIGAWVTLAGIYGASLLGCAWTLPRVRSAAGAGSLAAVLGLTAMGIAGFGMYLGRASSWWLHATAIPPIVLLTFWIDRLTCRSTQAPRAFRFTTATCAYGVALLAALHLREPLDEWLHHPSPHFLAAESPLNRTWGCSAFPRCLFGPRPAGPGAEEIVQLIAKYAPPGRPVGVFLGALATPDVLLGARRRHAFPLSAPAQDGLVPGNAARIVGARHSLLPGDRIFVDRAQLMAPLLFPLIPVERQIVDRLCREFDCRVEEVVGNISVERLDPRPEHR